jgi:hypothetical protein
MDWDSVFDTTQKEPGAPQSVLDRFVAEVGLPITAQEVETINRSQQNPFPPTDPLYAAYRPFDPSAWVIPNRPLPASYLSLLRWSDGGWGRTGEREFGFFSALCPSGGVRAMLLAYQLPQYMPNTLPIAFNGGGIFYLFDMRRPAVKGEYPIVAASAGYLSWDREAWRLVAETFPVACRGTTNIEELWV